MTATALKRLTKAQFSAMKATPAPCPAKRDDGTPVTINVRGFGLYEHLRELVSAINKTGLAAMPTSNMVALRLALLEAHAELVAENFEDFASRLPSNELYVAVFREYAAAPPRPARPAAPAPAPSPTPVPTPPRRTAPAPALPRSAGTPDPLELEPLELNPIDDPDDDFDDAPIAPVTSRRSAAARFAPPAAPEGEPTIADVFTFFGGIVPTIDDHADMLDNHEAELFNPDGTSRLDQLEDAVFGGANPARPWTRRTSSAHVSDEASWGKIVGVAIVTFLGAFLVLLAVVGIVGAAVNYGPIAAIATWLWPITLLAIMAAIVASLVTYRSTTASAVTREERI